MAGIDQGYRPLEGHFDEMMTPAGDVRPHWAVLFERLRQTGQHEFTRRVQDSRRILREHGVTFHASRDARSDAARKWPLDIVPFVIDQADWAIIERAVVQRATLLNAVLRDVYGPQAAITDGTLPAEYVYQHPGFARACHGVRPAGDVWLNVYAADLARGPDGRWWVINDRGEAPEGAGYALENRIVVSQAFPAAFDASSIRRLASYFGQLKQSLAAAAPAGRAHPRVVLLTEGPTAPSYFEQAFLARYLGYTLVESSDLTVRDRHVYLRTLGGLLPVDAILRCQPTGRSDPLELGTDAVVGTAGLLDAVRSGSVSVANALGSGFVESPALMAFLPALCRRLLDEELQVPSVATWWCGQAAARGHVFDALDELLIKAAFPAADGSFGHVRRLGKRGRRALRDRIVERPAEFAAQVPLALSTTPVRVGTGIVPRFVVVRAYAVATGTTYRVMPGGLARVSTTLASLDVTVRGGGRSKDVWVVGPTDEPRVTLQSPVRTPTDVSRATFDLSSRVGENLYWLGRYAERLEATARLLRAMVPLLSAESIRHSSSAVASARAFLAELGYPSPPGLAAAEPGGMDDALGRLLLLEACSDDREDGLGWQIRQLYRAVSLLRDRLSADVWRIVVQLESDYRRRRSAVETWSELAALLDRVVLHLVGLGGAAVEGMTRGYGWCLLDMGRRIERALQVLKLLRHGLVGVSEDERARLELLLETADCAITYRSRYLTSLEADLVIDLLLVDDAAPRSVAFQLDRIGEHVGVLPDRSETDRPSSGMRLVSDLRDAACGTPLAGLAQVTAGRRNGLETLLTRVQVGLHQLSEALTRDYLTHATPPHRLGDR